jgi:hypothetical protein
MSIKLNRARRLSKIAQYPRTFEARLATIPQELRDGLTAKQIAALIDGPLTENYSAGHSAGYRDAQ